MSTFEPHGARHKTQSGPMPFDLNGFAETSGMPDHSGGRAGFPFNAPSNSYIVVLSHDDGNASNTENPPEPFTA